MAIPADSQVVIYAQDAQLKHRRAVLRTVVSHFRMCFWQAFVSGAQQQWQPLQQPAMSFWAFSAPWNVVGCCLQMVSCGRCAYVAIGFN